MPVLQPYERTFLSHLKIEGRSGRQSQPGPSIKCFVGFAHLAFEDQQLNASRIWFAVRLSGRPPMYFNSFLVDRMQFFYSLPRRDSISVAIKGRVELCSVILRELPQLNEDRATIIRTRRVCGIDRVAHVGSGRVIAVFILKVPSRTRNSSPPWCACGAKALPRPNRTMEVARATSSPTRSNILRSTPADGEETHGMSRAWALARSEKSAFSLI